jgi:oligopeptide/dipeptide ABC transporter ATP-binding protein
MGLISPPNVATGKVILNAHNLLELPQGEMDRLRGTVLTMIFQAAMNTLDPTKTVGKSMLRLLLDKQVANNRREALEMTAKLIENVGLQEWVNDAYPHQLSGGMKQRAVIAMAVSTKPRVLVADEPTTALDTITQFSILSLLKDLKQKNEIGSIILISHDTSVQAYMSDRLAVMYRGEVVEIAKSGDLLTNPKHPYAQLLVSSVSLEGEVKAPVIALKSFTAGCPYAQHCPHAFDRCLKEKPLLRMSEPNHPVACFLYGENS